MLSLASSVLFFYFALGIPIFIGDISKKNQYGISLYKIQTADFMQTG